MSVGSGEEKMKIEVKEFSRARETYAVQYLTSAQLARKLLKFQLRVSTTYNYNRPTTVVRTIAFKKTRRQKRIRIRINCFQEENTHSYFLHSE